MEADLQFIYEKDLGCFQKTIELLSQVDPKMLFMNSCKLQTKALILNVAPIKIFSNYINYYGVNEELANSISLDRIKEWFTSKDFKFECYCHFLLRKLVVSGVNVYDEKVETSILKIFLNGVVISYNSAWCETFKIFLMYAKTLPKISFFKNYSYPGMQEVLSEFYANRCEMLELECQTKSKLLDEFNSKK
jgi:hypothetical protein